MKPINCGVFDEVSRRCIHCGEIQEGSQCTYDYTWKRGEFTLHAARLLYGSMALHDVATDTVTIIDRTETPYDPMQHAVQAYRLLHKLVLNHRCVVQYSTDYSRFLITTDRGNVRYLPRPSERRRASRHSDDLSTQYPFVGLGLGAHRDGSKASAGQQQPSVADEPVQGRSTADLDI